jgi:hypothetical protein
MGLFFVFLLMPLVIHFSYRVFRKLGFKELGRKEILDIEKLSFPGWYKYVYISVFIVFFGSWIGFSFLSIYWWFPNLQRWLFTSNSTIFFRGDPHAYAFIIFFFSIFILSSLGGYVVSAFFPRFELYSYSRAFKKDVKNELSLLKFPPDFYKRWIVLNLIVFLPFLYLSFTNYIRITDKEIVIKYYFPVMNKTYSWNEVTLVNLHGFNQADEAPYLDFTFNNGKTIDLWTGFFMTKAKNKEVIELIKTVKNKGIPLTVADLNDAEREGLLNLKSFGYLEAYEKALKISRGLQEKD